jgi:hypothetical protein
MTEWNADLVTAIKLLAETPTTDETPGAVWDELYDMLIATARLIAEREELGNEGHNQHR